MKRFFGLYQYAAPLLIMPLAYVLWFERLGGRHDLTLLVLSWPVVTSYIIPAIGTNYLKLWEFDTRLRLGRFRPHHGFVFGSGMSLLAWVCLPATPPTLLSMWEVTRQGLVLGSFTGFWNWIYDAYAIKCGFITIYNRPHAQGAPPAAIAADYAPMYFGLFGFCFGALIYLVDYFLYWREMHHLYWWILGLGMAVILTLPTLLYSAAYYVRHGELGIYPHHDAPA
jgi:hypothetical protein